MTRTYVTSPLSPNMSVPKLHKVVYGKRDISGPLVYEYAEASNIREWCKHHCKEPFYMSPGWMEEVFVQFEDDEDAVLFALSIPLTQNI